MIKMTDLVTEWTTTEKKIMVEHGFIHHKTWPGEDEFADFYEKMITIDTSKIIDKQGGVFYTSECKIKNNKRLPGKFKKIKKLQSLF